MSNQLKKIKLRELVPLLENPNEHTERGMAQLDMSLDHNQWFDAGTLAANNEVLSGNGRVETLAEKGVEEVYVWETDGSVPLFVKRTNIESADDPKGQEIIIAANRVAEVNLRWNADVLEHWENKDELKKWWHEWEVDLITKKGQDFSVDEAWQGMPEFEQDEIKPFHSIKVHFRNSEDIQAFAKLIEQTVTDKTTFIYYPKQENEDLTQFRVIDSES